jgi:hypothetical protein
MFPEDPTSNAAITPDISTIITVGTTIGTATRCVEETEIALADIRPTSVHISSSVAGLLTNL